MPPPLPPPLPPPAKLPSNPLTLNNNAQKTNKSKNEVVDKNALLSQIRQGTKLKKATTNDRSAPIVGNVSSSSGSSNKQSEAKPITPSMFKNGAGPLNLNFGIPSGIGPSSLKKTKPNSTLNSASSNITLKSNSSTGSTLSNRTINSDSSANSIAKNNIAKNLTLKSPSKSQFGGEKLSTPPVSTHNFNNTLNSTLSKPNDTLRPSVKPPALPAKPPVTNNNNTSSSNNNNLYVNRRQSFDSGQIVNKLQTTINSSLTNDNNNFNSNLNKNKSTSNVNKPAPPPRLSTSNEFTNRQNKSTQNLSSLGSNNNSPMNYSTMKLKTNTKNYTSTSRPLGPPPPPPIPKPSQNSQTYNSPNVPKPPSNQSKFSLKNSQIYNAPNVPPLPNIPLPPIPPANQFNSPPLPPSLASVTPNLNAFNQNIAPMPPVRNSSNLNTSKDLESRFQNQFKDEGYLPAPDTFTNCKKIYCSAAGSKSVRSRAPLPPNENHLVNRC